MMTHRQQSGHMSPQAAVAAAEGDTCAAQIAKGRTEQDRADPSQAGVNLRIT